MEERRRSLEAHHQHTDGTAGLSTDLVEYLIVSVPDLESLATLAPALAELVRNEAIRILDVVVLDKDADGVVTALELDAIDSMAELRTVVGELGGMLSDHDVELASLAIRPRTVGAIVVTEDRWAEPLSSAARIAGGQIIAGERIPASRVQQALSEGLDDDRGMMTNDEL
jgi:hypothetical protein